MLSLIEKPRFLLIVLILPVLFACGWAQDKDNSVEWDADWKAVLSDDGLSPSDQLTQLTDLLLEWGEATGWSTGANWSRTVELLTAWEASPDIEIARDAYLRILDTIGWGTLYSSPIQGHEQELREFYQRALRITENPEEEGKLLFHLAASIYRSEPDSLETRRRIEAYLEQASLAAGTLPIAADINMLLGSIFAEWGKSGDASVRDEVSYYSRAVYHLQQVLTVQGADSGVLETAGLELEQLLQSGLNLLVRNRYHPEDDVRVSVSTRNIAELEIRLSKIPVLPSGLPVPMDKLESLLEPVDSTEANTVLQKNQEIEMRNRVDWQESEIRLGSDLPAGWYRLTVTGSGITTSSLLLVTDIETVLIPRSNGNLTLWVLDAESGYPVETSLYHVLDNTGNLLFSGTSNPSGMAEIATGNDETWAEIHVSHAGSPAVIRRSDLGKDADPSPWIIPDSMGVYPGERLGWTMVVADGTAVPEFQDMRIHLPDGQILPPESDTSAQGHYFHVQLPAEADIFGPIYLQLTSGKRILCSHLRRREPLPYTIELKGERFSSDKNLFVSSAPVGVTVHGSNLDDTASTRYIRILVEKLDRPASFAGPGTGTSGDGVVAFEHITQFGDAGVQEAYWELPEIEQTQSPVPLRISVFPLESDQLLGETYLSIVPYRARVSIKSSEKIIATGASVMIEILDVQKGISMTRLPEGELVAFRESWENRYVHRKKGTPLSETEYNALPDRSMLGSAKTDYRLEERGIVREEVLRSRLNPVESTRIPIVFERHGYYRIEFHGRDADVRAHYPEGDIEVWVLPESGDLNAFKSEVPRLILEQTESGDKEVLVLMDRGNATILLDLQNKDGRSVTRFIKPQSGGYYLLWTDEDSPLQVCRAIISGERRTDFLCQHVSTRSQIVWNVQIDQVNGLNPGSDFRWQATVQKGEFTIPPVWAIYPETDGELADDYLNLQRIQQTSDADGCAVKAVAMSARLPLEMPVEFATGPERDAFPALNPFNDLNVITAVYPELRQDSGRGGGFVEFSAVTGQAGNQEYELSGALPLSAGRWCLAAFTTGDQSSFDVRTWIFSTELPIRTTISGPPVMRIGDTASASLRVENTTRRMLSINVQSVPEGSIQNVDSGIAAVELPSQQDIRLAVAFNAVRAGDGRLSSTVKSSLSSSTAFLGTRVLQPHPVPVLQSYFAAKGIAGWEKSIDLSGWKSVQVLVSSGIGGHLATVWPVARDAYVVREPLLTRLTDWALENVKHHHGLNGPATLNAQELKALIDRYFSGSGISWTPGRQPDPWLSGLVLWAIETFSDMSDENFSGHKTRLRGFLESVLISDTSPVDARIFALRTLAAQANNDPRKRPSRIQAKSFLEFFHSRDQLSVGEAAMLMDVARSFRLIQEIHLLANSLKQRLDEPQSLERLSQWDASLIYLALSQDTGSSELQVKALDAVIARAGMLTSQPGWEQVGSYLNFLAAFLWEGDFSVDGSVMVGQGDKEPLRVPLKPHGDNRGELLLTTDQLQLDQNQLRLKLDTSLSEQPVLISVLGIRETPAEGSQYPVQTVDLSREFVEHTLLAGSHVHSNESSLDDTYYPGDTLLQRIQLDVGQPQPYAEFTFMIPAGTSLSGTDIQHKVRPASTEQVLTDPVITFMQQTNPLQLKIRVEPFSQGQHEFLLPYRVNWSGTYRFPYHNLVYPKSGEDFHFGSAGLMRIEPGH